MHDNAGDSEGPSLLAFLSGPALAANVSLRCQLLLCALKAGALQDRAWAAVLEAVGTQASCLEVVAQVVAAQRAGSAVWAWALAVRDADAAPVALRLRLQLLCGGSDPAPGSLKTAASRALLTGEPLPAEAVHLLDIRSLWEAALEQDAHSAAAALVSHVPREERGGRRLDGFLARGLLHQKRSSRRACLEVLRETYGSNAAALLALLSEQQPLHLVKAVNAQPPQPLVDVAAELALRYGDDRVHAFALEALPVSETCLLEAFAAAALRQAGAVRPLAWTRLWQQRLGRGLSQRHDFAPLAGLLLKPFPAGSLDILLANWAEGQCTLDASADVDAVRALRRHDAALAARVARQTLLVADRAALPPLFLLELVLCDPGAGCLDAGLCEAAAQAADRRSLAALAELAPGAVASFLAKADAPTALWALGSLPKAEAVACTAGAELGFAVKLHESPPFAPTSWAAAWVACEAEPELADWYPSSDPDYLRTRAALLALGPLAAAHVDELADAQVLKQWAASPTMPRLGRLRWLAAARRLLLRGAADLRDVTQAKALEWAKDAAKDAPMLCAALGALAAAQSGPGTLEALWPVVKTGGGEVARQVAEICGVGDLPDSLMERVLASSTMSAALAMRQLSPGEGAAAATPHVPTLAALAVRAVAATGSHGVATHPSLQLCRALPMLPSEVRAQLLSQLLTKELPTLPPEGSPRGEGHHRHVRLWLVVGSILEVEQSLAGEVAAAVEPALRVASQLPTRLLLQNVWARAAWVNDTVLEHLCEVVEDLALPEGLAPRCIAVAAQLVLHPANGALSAPGANLRPFAARSGLQRLVKALVAWSATYVQAPRLLASLALYHALDRGLLETPGWYLESLHRALVHGDAFTKLRKVVDMNRWISGAWAEVQPVHAKPLDVMVSLAQKKVSGGTWLGAGGAEPAAEAAGEAGGGDAGEEPQAPAYQRRPDEAHRSSWLGASAAGEVVEPDVVVVGSLLGNLPNMAGLVRTAEALLGPRAEVTLHSLVVLSDPAFLKMSVAAERAGHIVVVPQGPRLLEFLREKRCEGFTVAALEQTSTSRLLCAETPLPRKLVLLVGSEQHGVPVWLVQSGLIDMFLELPLLGRTGSLNAHVAASMALWHYRLQH